MTHWTELPTVADRLAAQGIARTEITSDSVKSREEWAELGRRPREGAEGVKVLTFRQSISTSVGCPVCGFPELPSDAICPVCGARIDAGAKFRRPRVIVVLHVSQVEPIEGCTKISIA